MTEEWVPVLEAARHVGVTKGTVHRWTREGDLEFKMIEVTGDYFKESYEVKAVRLADAIARRNRTNPAPVPRGEPCSIEGCGKPVLGKGWCSAHYSLHRRTGDPLTPVAKGADILGEFWHLAGLIGEGRAILRIAEVYRWQPKSVVSYLQKAGWAVWTDHLGRVRVTAAEGQLGKEKPA